MWKWTDNRKIIFNEILISFQTVRTFLDKMIERKRGHIVGISSLGGKITFPYIGYTASKFGVKGFMGGLYDELCAEKNDKIINVTTVYPSFISTRKELCDFLDELVEVAPRMSPKYVANEIVKGILINKMDVTLPHGAGCLQILNFLPTRAMKFAKAKFNANLPYKNRNV